MKKAFVFAVLFTLSCSVAVWGGGFWITAATPKASAPAGTVATVYPMGCHQPAEASFVATAEGLVNGQRQTVKLKEVRIEGGALAIQPQWPQQGRWVLAVTATYSGQTRSVLIKIDPQNGAPVFGDKKEGMLARSLTEKDIVAALGSL